MHRVRWGMRRLHNGVFGGWPGCRCTFSFTRSLFFSPPAHTQHPPFPGALCLRSVPCWMGVKKDFCHLCPRATTFPDGAIVLRWRTYLHSRFVCGHVSLQTLFPSLMMTTQTLLVAIERTYTLPRSLCWHIKLSATSFPCPACENTNFG